MVFKNLTILAIALAGFCLLNVANGTIRNICTNQPDGTLIRNVRQCNEFFNCTQGEPRRLICSFPYQFNPFTKKCVDQQFVTCFKCPIATGTNGFIDVAVDYQCNQFVRCFDNVPTHLVCADGLLFDSENRQCNFEKNVACACPVVDNPDNPQIDRDRDNCAIYHVCSGGKRTTLRCPPGLYFNTVTNQCDWPINTDCNSNSTTLAP